MEKAETLQGFFRKLGQYAVITRNRMYFIEIAALLVICILIINAIAPASDALYFLLILPAVLVVIGICYCFIKILQRPELGIPIIAIMLPFERIGALSSSSFNVRLSQIFTVFTLLAYIFYTGFTDKKNRFGGMKIKKDVSFLLLIIFALVNIVSLAVAVNKGRSMYVLAFDIFIFFVYIFISNLLISKDIVRKTVWALLGIACIVSLFGIFQFAAGMLNLPTSISGLREGYTKAVFGFPRVQATESEPQFWGNFLIIPVSLSLSILLNTLGKSKQRIGEKFDAGLTLLAGITLILALINILMTFSRGAWFATIACIGIIIVFNLRNFITIRNLITTAIVVAIAIAGFWGVLVYSNAPLNLTVLTNRASQITDSDRTLTMNDAIRYFRSHQILGIGVGSFGPYEAPNMYQQPQAYGLNIGWRIVNNEYIEILAETGIIGFIAFAAFIIYLLLNLLSAIFKPTDMFTRTILIGLFAAYISLLIQYYAFSTLYVMDIWFLFAVANAVAFNVNSRMWKYDKQ